MGCGRLKRACLSFEVTCVRNLDRRNVFVMLITLISSRHVEAARLGTGLGDADKEIIRLVQLDCTVVAIKEKNHGVAGMGLLRVATESTTVNACLKYRTAWRCKATGIGGVLAEFHACSQPGPLSRCLRLSRSDPGLLGWPIHSGVSLCRYLIARAPALRFLLLW